MPETRTTHIGGIYAHYKGGRYVVLATARDATNGPNEGRWMVVYQSLVTKDRFVRSEAEFHMNVVIPADEDQPAHYEPRFKRET